MQLAINETATSSAALWVLLWNGRPMTTGEISIALGIDPSQDDLSVEGLVATLSQLCQDGRVVRAADRWYASSAEQRAMWVQCMSTMARMMLAYCEELQTQGRTK
jgi:hypothetical protein